MNQDEHLTIRPRSNDWVALAEISKELNLQPQQNLEEVFVNGVTIDSRDVRDGDLYVAMQGAEKHGAEFWADALKRGAKAILTDEKGLELSRDSGLPIIVSVVHPRLILGSIASAIYKTESHAFKTFGVTGTDGKTSIMYLLDTLLTMAGYKTGISTTVERRIGGTSIASNLTSPEAAEMHALLARMREEQVQAVALEVSAQAVARNRIDGVEFDVVSFNNFTQDHLNEFGDMETYFAAKLGLFAPEHAKRGVVVVDSEYGQRIARESKIPVTTLATEYGQAADWHLAVTRHDLNGVSFVLQGPDDIYIRARVNFFGRFMAENAALSLIMMYEAGIDLAPLIKMLEKTPIDVKIPGRLELMSEPGKGPRFYVDHAHTPGSFISILDALDEVKEGRVLFMFGSDGGKDISKRDGMGAAASSGSDILVICDAHPRFEDPAGIRKQVIESARAVAHPAEIHEIPKPEDAIRYLVSIAQEKDIIIYAGPGHETYRHVAGEIIPFSARDEARLALKEAGLIK